MLRLHKIFSLALFILMSGLNGQTTTTSQSSGNWSNSSTWDNGVPDVNANVVISSGHTVTVQQSVTANMNDLTINSGGTLNSEALNISMKIKGDWTNSGSYLSGNSSTLSMIGSGAQVFSPGSNSYSSIIISNTGTNSIRFTADIDINKDLTLTDGTLDLNTNNPNISLSGDLSIANGATWTKGSGLITFDGSSQTYSDNNTTKQNIGNIELQ